MKIKIPLRISFIGGGTDIPPYFIYNQGESISCTIDKYAVVTDLPNGSIPVLNNYDDLKQAAIKLANEHQKDYVASLRVACEIPPGSGLGTSSSIALGLCIAIYGYSNPYVLAQKAIELERIIAGISGGIQDQYIAAFPGLTRFQYKAEKINPFNSDTDYKNLRLCTEIIPYHKAAVDTKELSNHLLLVDTGIIRRQANIMNSQIERNSKGLNSDPLSAIRNAVPGIHDCLINQDWYAFGCLLSDSWEWKKRLSDGIGFELVDEIINEARNMKITYGGKLLGAGGGGYVLLICEDREKAYYMMTAKGYRCITPNIVNEYVIE